MVTDTIDGVLIESDEDGFHLILSGGAAEYNFRIHGVAVELLKAVQREIGPWYAEGEAVYREMTRGKAEIGFVRPNPNPSNDFGLFFECADPQGEWEESMRDAADLQRKREKGE